MKKIGLTGVMGAGKSSVIALLKKYNINVLDCDAINHELLQKGNKGYNQLVSIFDKQILDEEANIDKAKMADVIFKNDESRKLVESFLHPLIKEEINERIKKINQKIVVVEVPLLFEIGWEDEFDEIWVVACSEQIRLERLMMYRGISYKEAKRRIDKQMAQELKIKKANFVLYNDYDLAYLEQQIVEKLESGD